MTKNNRQFREFLRDEVNLTQRRLHRLHLSVRDVNRHLKADLHVYQSIDRQGSYGLDTFIRPVNEDDEYDADIQVVMNPNPNWQARDYLDALSQSLAKEHNFAGKIELGTRCVTLNYTGEFHLDVVPRITQDGVHYICNRELNKLQKTDGQGYRNWFSERSRVTRVNLKRTVRLLKFIRDRQDNYVAKCHYSGTLGQ